MLREGVRHLAGRISIRKDSELANNKSKEDKLKQCTMEASGTKVSSALGVLAGDLSSNKYRRWQSATLAWNVPATTVR